ncbi:MAG: phosphate signaling complex protein PhoU [Spirochaetota bacterium]
MATRLHFIERMNKLDAMIMKMGSLVIRSLERSMQALIDQDVALATEVVEADREINELELAINDHCTTLIAEEQPVARDLRIILNALKTSHNLERIGDNAVHISKSALRLAHEPYMKPFIDIPRMAEIATGMVRDALDSYTRMDSEGAVEVSKRDVKVDELYSQIFRELVTCMHDDPGKINQAMSLLFVCRRLERVADQSTHICEGTIFIATGRHVDLNE